MLQLAVTLFLQKSESESVESLTNMEDPTTSETNLGGEENHDNEMEMTQPVFIADPRDIELMDGDLGLGERTFNPRS